MGFKLFFFCGNLSYLWDKCNHPEHCDLLSNKHFTRHCNGLSHSFIIEIKKKSLAPRNHAQSAKKYHWIIFLFCCLFFFIFKIKASAIVWGQIIWYSLNSYRFVVVVTLLCLCSVSKSHCFVIFKMWRHGKLLWLIIKNNGSRFFCCQLYKFCMLCL